MKIALTEEQVAKILTEYFYQEYNIKVESTGFTRSYLYNTDFCTLISAETTEKKDEQL